MHKLHEQFDIHGDIFLLLVDYFKNRKTYVKVGNEYSYEYDDDIGVPQGSVLGALLFLLYG